MKFDLMINSLLNNSDLSFNLAYMKSNVEHGNRHFFYVGLSFADYHVIYNLTSTNEAKIENI
jgi:hypothetical protein